MHHDKVSRGNEAGGRNLLDHDKRADSARERKRSNENIDPALSHLNTDYSARRMTPGEAWAWACEYAQAHASRRLRDNQVVMSEDVVHLPDNWDEVSGGEPDSVFFERCALPFLRQRYGYGEGGTENEVSAVVHRDEVVRTGPNRGRVTAHLHYKDVPVDRDGKLNHKGVHDRKDLRTLHRDFAAFCEAQGYHGLHVWDEERARARENALSMPEYKQAMAEVDGAREREAAKLQGLEDEVAEKQGIAAGLSEQISEKTSQVGEIQGRIDDFSEKEQAARERLESVQAALGDAESMAREGLGGLRKVAREGGYVGGRERRAGEKNRELRARVEALEGEGRELGERCAALEREGRGADARVVEAVGRRDGAAERVQRLGERKGRLGREVERLGERVQGLERRAEFLRVRLGNARSRLEDVARVVSRVVATRPFLAAQLSPRLADLLRSWGMLPETRRAVPESAVRYDSGFARDDLSPDDLIRGAREDVERESPQPQRRRGFGRAR